MFFKKRPDISEEELLKKYFSNGEQGLLGQLFEPHIGWVFSVCLGYLKNRQDAEDAVVNIYEKIGVELRKHDVSNFKSWLRTLARNHCLMALRKKKPQIVNMEEVFNLPIMDSEVYTHQESELQKLEDCIEKLKNEHKIVVHLFYQKEKCYQEISDDLKLDLKKVKSALQNGRRMLKNCMESR